MRHPTVLLLWIVLSATGLEAQTRVVALLGETAPGTADDFESFSLPVLNDLGEVAFVGMLADESSGVWSEGDGVGTLRSVATAGDMAPAAGGSTFGEFLFGDAELHLNNLGDVTFKALLDDFSTTGVWTDRDRPSTPVTNIVLDGQQPPGAVAGRQFHNGFSIRAMGRTHSGTALYGTATAAPAPDNFPLQAVYSEATGSTLAPVAEFTDLAPDTVRPSIGGGLANFTRLTSPAINDLGNVVFMAETNAGTGAGSIGEGGIWKTTGGGTSLTSVALAGQTAPGTSTTFSQIFGQNGPVADVLPMMNNSGDVVFMATLVGLIEGDLRAGVWAERGGTVAKVAFETEIAPGTTNKFDQIDTRLLLDASGRTAFMAQLEGGTEGVWRESAPGTLAPALLTGQTPTGASAPLSNLRDFAINDSGTLVVSAEMTDFSEGIVVVDLAGNASQLLGTGDWITVNGSATEVQFLDFAGSHGSGGATANGLNNAGQVALYFEGEDVETFDFVSGVIVLNSASASLPGDYNQNGTVDAADYTLWRDSQGESGAGLAADGNGDGTVNSLDYTYWADRFGQTTSETQSVPEPGAWMLVLAAGLLLVPRAK